MSSMAASFVLVYASRSWNIRHGSVTHDLAVSHVDAVWHCSIACTKRFFSAGKTEAT